MMVLALLALEASPSKAASQIFDCQLRSYAKMNFGPRHVVSWSVTDPLSSEQIAKSGLQIAFFSDDEIEVRPMGLNDLWKSTKSKLKNIPLSTGTESSFRKTLYSISVPAGRRCRNGCSFTFQFGKTNKSKAFDIILDTNSEFYTREKYRAPVGDIVQSGTFVFGTCAEASEALT